MTEIAWIDVAFRSARPRAMGALLRYFRDLDAAEEAFQEACLSALDNWPRNGPPRDPADRARPARRLGPDRQADRPGLPGGRERDGAADHQGEGPDRRRRRPLR